MPGYRNIIKVLLFLPVLMLVSCASDDGKRLADIESYIEDNPDSALVEIRSMPEPTRRCQKAKHALLHSMALDKCWVDLQTDSIIAPAVSWYSRLGRPDDRLKMYYYRARIAQNAGDEETAMQWLVKGERFVRRSRDNAALGRYYSFKSELYFNSYQYLAAERDIRTAYGYHKQFRISKNAITSLLDLANIRYVQYDFEGADEVLDSLFFLYPSLREKQYEGFQHKRYLAMRLDICHELKLDPQPWLDTIHASIENYENYPMLEMAEAFNQRNMPDSARKYLDMYEEVYSDSEHNARFFFENSEQLALSGQFEAAYMSVRDYLNWQFGDFLKEVKSETRFIEERLSAERAMNAIRLRHMIVVGISLAFAVAVFFLLLALRRHKRKVKELESKYSLIAQEREELHALLSSSTLDDESRALLNNRLDVIEDTLLARVKRSRKDDIALLDELIGGKKNILTSLALLFSINHQNFVSYLKSRCRHPNYHGATLVNVDNPNSDAWGITLGPYINGMNLVADPSINTTFAHEYGHTIQSKLIGPTYLFVVGIPSIVGSVLDYELHTGHDHDREWYEVWSNQLSYNYHDKNGNTDVTTNWDDTSNPRSQNLDMYFYDTVRYYVTLLLAALLIVL